MSKAVQPEEPTRSALVACMLAWLVPGAGHWFLDRRQHAVLYFLVIVGLFVTGLTLHGKLYLFFAERHLDYQTAAISVVGTIVGAFNGIAYLVALFLGYQPGDIERSTFEIGVNYILTAGLLNILVIFDVFDVARKRK